MLFCMLFLPFPIPNTLYITELSFLPMSAFGISTFTHFLLGTSVCCGRLHKNGVMWNPIELEIEKELDDTNNEPKDTRIIIFPCWL